VPCSIGNTKNGRLKMGFLIGKKPRNKSGHSDRETWQKWTNEPLESLGFSKDSFGCSLGLAEKERPEMRVAMDSGIWDSELGNWFCLASFWGLIWSAIPLPTLDIWNDLDPNVLRGEYYCRYWFVLLLCCMDHSWRRDGTYTNWRLCFLAYGIRSAKNSCS